MSVASVNQAQAPRETLLVDNALRRRGWCGGNKERCVSGPVWAFLFAVCAVAVIHACSVVVDSYAASDGGIRLLFKLDPRITRGMYLGERWVSPPTYTRVQEGTELSIEARAQLGEVSDRPAGGVLHWIPSDPNMVQVSPASGHEVTITVRDAGESELTVSSGFLRRNVFIRAERRDNVLHVDIVQ